MQVALDKFTEITERLDFVINEEITKIQGRATASKNLTVNSKFVDWVRSYKYQRIYIGQKADNKEAELTHLLTQCKEQLQLMKALTWSGNGVGVPVLRTMYISIVKSLIDHASPVL